MAKSWDLAAYRSRESRDVSSVDAGIVHAEGQTIFAVYHALLTGRDRDWVKQYAIVDAGEAAGYVGELAWRLRSLEPASILDVGCGPGTLTEALRQRWPSAMALGVEMSASAVSYAQQTYPRCTFRCLSLEASTELDGRFDLVHVREFYPFVRGDAPSVHAGYLTMLARHLTPNGRLVLVQRVQPVSLTSTLSRGEIDVTRCGLRLERRYELARAALRKRLPISVAAHMSPLLRRIVGRDPEILLVFAPRTKR